MENSKKLTEFPLPAYRNLSQVISLPVEDGQCAEDIVASTVRILPSRSGRSPHEKASSMLTLKSEVDYNWEDRYYMGNLVAVHTSGNLLAYAISDRQTHDGAVRIMSKKGSGRALLKGMKGPVQDLAFCLNDREVFLAVVDEPGNLFVYQIEADLSTKLMVQVAHDVKPRSNCSHRVIWVPYVPEDDIDGGDVDLFLVLVLLIGPKAELWSIGKVSAQYRGNPLEPTEILEGLMEIDNHTDTVVDAVFSPDGSALATASLDGTMQFFQIPLLLGGTPDSGVEDESVYMHQKPKCLHNWRPHDGRPLSFLSFLDNHEEIHPDSQFWKFVITGANNNTELKVFNCTQWSHIQTISVFTEGRSLRLKAALDPTANFLILSDQYSELLYLYKVFVGEQEEVAYIQSVSVYLVPFSILSFTIVDVTSHFLKATDSDDLDDFDDDDDDEDEEIENVTTLSMYLVHPKSLQDCKLQLLSPKPGGQLLLSNLVPDQPELPLPITLMTPKEFTSPAKPDVEPENITIKCEPVDLVVSGASSPSQEVRDIFNMQEACNEVSRLYNDEPELSNGAVKTKEEPSEPAQPTDWPNIPLIPDSLAQVEKMTSRINKRQRTRTKRREKQLRSAVFVNRVHKKEEKTIEKDKRESLGKTETRTLEIEETAPPNHLTANVQSDIQVKLDAIMALLQNQDAQIKELRQRLQKREESGSVAEQVQRVLDTHISRLHDQQARREVDERDRQETLLFAISQAVENLIAVKLEEVVPTEIRKNVLPLILSDMEPFKRNLHVEMTQQLSVTDHLLKENISKLVHSKSVMEVLSMSLTSSLRSIMADTCKELMGSFLLPRLEKVLEKTFQQIHDSFTAGTRECLELLRRDADKVKGELNRAEQSLKEAAEMNKNTAGLLHTEIEKSLLSVAEKIKKQLVETIQKELKSSKPQLETTVTSRAKTPAFQVHEKQALITQLLAASQYNTAFQEALSASDLNIVVFTCEKISAEQLFSISTKSPLQQPVLLSLVQQLSADLTKDTDLKSSYLTEACLRLEPHHPTTKEHLLTVITEIVRNIVTYLDFHPNCKVRVDLNRTLMVLKLLLSGKVHPLT